MSELVVIKPKNFYNENDYIHILYITGYIFKCLLVFLNANEANKYCSFKRIIERCSLIYLIGNFETKYLFAQWYAHETVNLQF